MKGYKRILPLSATWIVISFAILSMNTGLVNTVARVAVAILLIAAVIVPYYLHAHGGATPFYRRNRLWVTICTLLFLLMLPASRLIASGIFHVDAMYADYPSTGGLVLCRVFQVLGLPLIALAVWMLISVVFDRCCRGAERTASAERYDDLTGGAVPFIKIGGIRIYKWLLPIAMAVIVAQVLSYPCLPVPDMLGVYNGITQQRWSDWHPIGYCLFVYLGLLPFGFHPFAFGVLQGILWILISNYTLGVIYRHTRSKTALCIYGVLSSVLIFALYTAYIVKDTMFGMCMLGLCVAIYDFVRSQKLPIIRGGGDGLFLALFSVGVSLFRHAGVIVAVGSLALVMLYALKKHWIGFARALILTLLPAVAFVCVHVGIGNHILHMEPNPEYVKFSTPLYVAANFASKHEELLDENDIAVMSQFMPVSDWKLAYESGPYTTDSVARQWGVPGERINGVDNAYGMEILKLNARLLLRSPTAYLSALTKPSAILWMIAQPSDDASDWLLPTNFPYDVPGYPSLPNFFIQEKALGTAIQTAAKFIASVPILRAIYFRGGFWLFVLFLAVAVFSVKFKNAPGWLLLPLSVPLLYSALLFLSCPTQDVRYVLYNMEIGVFLIPMMLYDSPDAPCIRDGADTGLRSEQTTTDNEKRQQEECSDHGTAATAAGRENESVSCA